jgi:hypothetical protein
MAPLNRETVPIVDVPDHKAQSAGQKVQTGFTGRVTTLRNGVRP